MSLRRCGRRADRPGPSAALTALSLATVAAAVCGVGCRGSGPAPEISSFAGDYLYSGANAEGAIVVTGQINFRVNEADEVSGGWSLHLSGDPEEVGPQSGTGVLTGSVVADTLTVDLRPAYRDNNVILRGSLDGADIEGVWQWITYSGVTNAGSFRAVRLRPD